MTDYDDLLNGLEGGNEGDDDIGVIIGNPEPEEEEEDIIIYAKEDENNRRNSTGEYDDEDYYEDEDELKAYRRIIVPINPDLPMYKVRITFLDESSTEYTVTEDWTIANLIAAVSESIGLLNLADMFFLSEGIRSTLMEPKSTNEVWLPLNSPITACGLTPKRIEDPMSIPIYFRMRWFRIPACGLTSPAIIHQMYLHGKRSLTSETVRIGPKEAGELGGLQLQATIGNFERGEQHMAGMITKADPGTYFSEAIVAHNESTREELETLIFNAHEKCKGLTPLDAEKKYVEDASKCQVPMFGATVFRVKGSTGAERHVGVLRDGIVIDIGTFEGFRFHPYKDVVTATLGNGGQNENELSITVHVPVTAGTALTTQTPTETMHFATPEAPDIVDLIYGYMYLMGKKERVVPREKVPHGMPSPDLFLEQEPREVLVPYATLIDFFYAMLNNMYEEQHSEPPEHVMAAVEYAHVTDSILDTISFTQYNGLPPLKPQHIKTLGLAISKISNYSDKRGVISNVRFTSVDFTGLDLTSIPEVMPTIKTVCRCSAPLTRIVLKNMGISRTFGGEIGEAVGSIRTLQEFNISHNPLLGNTGVNALLKGLDKLTANLSRVCLADTGLTSVTIITHIADYLSKHSHVKSLSIGHNPEICKSAKKKQFSEEIMSLLKRSALTELDITSCEVGKVDLLEIITKLLEVKSFKKFHIGYNPGVTDKLLNTITSWAENDSMFLSLLDVAGCKLGKKPLGALLQGAAKSSSYFTDFVLRSVPIHKSLAPHIKSLGQSKIAHLDLSYSSFSDSKLVEALADAVSESKTLVELRLAGNSLPAKLLKDIASAVMGCKTLVTLDVADCGIKGKEAVAFIEGLRGHKSLSVLILDKIKASEEVFTAIADLLSQDSSPISNLSMKEMSFSMKALNNFLESLPASVSLPSFDLRGNKIKYDSLKKVPNVYVVL